MSAEHGPLNGLNISPWESDLGMGNIEANQ